MPLSMLHRYLETAGQEDAHRVHRRCRQLERFKCECSVGRAKKAAFRYTNCEGDAMNPDLKKLLRT